MGKLKQEFKLCDSDMEFLIQEVYTYLTKDKLPCFTCDFILGWNKQRHSKLALERHKNNINQIVLNKNSLMRFHPLYAAAKRYSPDCYPDLLSGDINQLYSTLLEILINDGYSLIIEDSFLFPEDIMDTITYIKNAGYHINVTVLKKELIYQRFNMIFNYIVAAASQEKRPILERVKVSIESLVERVISKDIYTLFVIDPYITAAFYYDNGKIKKQLVIAPQEEEDTFEQDIELIANFTKRFAECFDEGELGRILSWFDELRILYYDQIDVELLTPVAR